VYLWLLRLVEDSRRENGADEAERMVKTVRVDANRSCAAHFEAANIALS
jgi:hypothetical protein